MSNKNNEKNKIIEIPEYKQYSRLRLLSFFIIGIIGVSVIGGILFVYSNIYTAIGQTQTVISLNTSLTIEIIDFGRYDRVDKAWKDKYSDRELKLSRDPFNKGAIIEEVIKTEEVVEEITEEAEATEETSVEEGEIIKIIETE